MMGTHSEKYLRQWFDHWVSQRVIVYTWMLELTACLDFKGEPMETLWNQWSTIDWEVVEWYGWFLIKEFPLGVITMKTNSNATFKSSISASQMLWLKCRFWISGFAAEPTTPFLTSLCLLTFRTRILQELRPTLFSSSNLDFVFLSLDSLTHCQEPDLNISGKFLLICRCYACPLLWSSESVMGICFYRSSPPHQLETLMM